jgi:hypothetical protein
MVTVDARGDHLVIASNWTSEGTYPLFFLGEWAKRADEPVGDEVLGGLVRDAFKACRVGVPTPDMRNDPEGEARLAALRELGGVRSNTAYVRTSRHVSLLWDDKKRTIDLASHQSRASGGFEGIRDAEIVVKVRIRDAELGRAVRRAVAASRSLAEAGVPLTSQRAEGLAGELAAEAWDGWEPAMAALRHEGALEGRSPLDADVVDGAWFPADGEDLAEGGVEDLLRAMAPALLRHGVELEVTAGEYPDDTEEEAYVIAINGRRCRILGSGDSDYNGDWYNATVRPLAMVNELLAEAGATVRVFTLFTGGNEGQALLLDARVPAAMARSGQFAAHEVPELPTLDSHP